MLEIEIIGTRHFPFPIIIPCPIPPTNGGGFSFKVFLVLFFFFFPSLYRELYSWKGEVTKPLFNQIDSAVTGGG